MLDFNLLYHKINDEIMLEMRFKLWDYDVKEQNIAIFYANF